MPEEEQRRLPHIYLPGHGNREDFTSPRSGGGSGAIPERDREEHAQRLEEMLTAAVMTAQERIASRDREISGGTPGFYLEFEILQAQQAVLDKLEYQRDDRIELVAARPSDDRIFSRRRYSFPSRDASTTSARSAPTLMKTTFDTKRMPKATSC